MTGGMHDDALPVTVLLPDTAGLPITLYDGGAALRMAVVERGGVHALATDWDRPGVYLLLDLHEPDGSWGCYVGKAAANGVRSRVLQHVANKDHWRRALLVQRDTTFGFTSADVGWLEGRLYDLLDAAGDTRLHNGNRPSDETVPAHGRLALEAAVAPIRRVLRLIGYDPASPDDQALGPAKRSSRFFGITVQDLLRSGLLSGGEQLTSTNSTWPEVASLLPDGRIDVRGTAHPTPSSAASAVKNGPANGWEFWAVKTAAGDIPLATLRARYADTQTSIPADGTHAP